MLLVRLSDVSFLALRVQGLGVEVKGLRFWQCVSIWSQHTVAGGLPFWFWSSYGAQRHGNRWQVPCAACQRLLQLHLGVCTGFCACGCVGAASECRPIRNQQYVQMLLFGYLLLLCYYCYLAVVLLCCSGANSSYDQL